MLVVVRSRTMRVTMRVPAVGVSVVVEEEEADNVARKTQRADDDDDLGVGDLGDVDEALQGFHKDGEAKREQEDAVNQRAEHLGALPAIRVAWILGVSLLGELREG